MPEKTLLQAIKDRVTNPDFYTERGIDPARMKSVRDEEELKELNEKNGGGITQRMLDVRREMGFKEPSKSYQKPHTDNQKKFFKEKGFTPKGGIVDAQKANGTVDANTGGAKVRPTQ